MQYEVSHNDKPINGLTACWVRILTAFSNSTGMLILNNKKNLL